MTPPKYFYGREAALGTRHEKEKVIGPLFQENLGIKIIVPKEFDSDRFGTFTLDVSRAKNQKETAVLKARAAMELTGLSAGLASEGSFGQYDGFPFGEVNYELVVYVDDLYGLEVFGSSFEPVTYAKNTIANNLEEVVGFADEIDFPDHAIVVRRSKDNYQNMIKGISSKNRLLQTASEIIDKNGSVWLETDLRAHVNKTRMKNISKATEDLILNLKRHCPSCDMPGFVKSKNNPGLPCEVCLKPTKLSISATFECSKCHFSQEIMYPEENKFASATYCDYCNP